MSSRSGENSCDEFDSVADDANVIEEEVVTMHDGGEGTAVNDPDDDVMDHETAEIVDEEEEDDDVHPQHQQVRIKQELVNYHAMKDGDYYQQQQPPTPTSPSHRGQQHVDPNTIQYLLARQQHMNNMQNQLQQQQQMVAAQQHQSQLQQQQAHQQIVTVSSSGNLETIQASGQPGGQQPISYPGIMHMTQQPQQPVIINQPPTATNSQGQQVIILSPQQLQQIINSIQSQQTQQQVGAAAPPPQPIQSHHHSQAQQIPQHLSLVQQTQMSRETPNAVGANGSMPSLYSPDHDADVNVPKKKSHKGPYRHVQTETCDLEELERFAKTFKRRRIELGFTQGDVGIALGKIYGSDFSQTTISRFEALNLSFKNMCKLKPLLDQWLKDAEALQQLHNHGQLPLTNDGTTPSLSPDELKFSGVNLNLNSLSQSANKKRKRRTSIDPQVRHLLEAQFDTNRKPTTEQIDMISNALNMDKEVIRVWFCNRRQKDKRVAIENIGGGLHMTMQGMSVPILQSYQHMAATQHMTSSQQPLSAINSNSSYHHQMIEQRDPTPPNVASQSPPKLTLSGLDILASHALQSPTARGPPPAAHLGQPPQLVASVGGSGMVTSEEIIEEEIVDENENSLSSPSAPASCGGSGGGDTIVSAGA